MSIPRMLYGIEVTPVSDSGIQELEQAHRRNAKIIQNLPTSTPTPAPLATLGWLTIAAQIAIMKITFAWKILYLPDKNIYKRVLLIILQQILTENASYAPNPLSPTASMYDFIKKYKMDQYFNDCSRHDNDRSINQTKSFIKQVVKDYESLCWRATCIMYPNLSLYMKTTSAITMHPWWVATRAKPHLTKRVAMLMSVMMGRDPTVAHYDRPNARCVRCDNYVTDDPVHVLFRCPELNNTRDRLMNNIRQNMPNAMKRDFFQISDENKVTCLFTGFGNRYIPEWQSLYEAVLYYVCGLYKLRGD